MSVLAALAAQVELVARPTVAARLEARREQQAPLQRNVIQFIAAEQAAVVVAIPLAIPATVALAYISLQAALSLATAMVAVAALAAGGKEERAATPLLEPRLRSDMVAVAVAALSTLRVRLVLQGGYG